MKTSAFHEDKHSEANSILTEEFHQTLSSMQQTRHVSDSSTSGSDAYKMDFDIDSVKSGASYSDASFTKMNSFVFLLVGILFIGAFVFAAKVTNLKMRLYEEGDEDFLLLNNEPLNRPFFLDIPGTGTSFIPYVLSECFGLNNVPITNIDISLHQENMESVDFLTTNSSSYLCETFKFNNQSRAFFLMQNPILRMALTYKERINPLSHMYDETLADVSFEEYLRTYEPDQNVMTKYLLCKDKELNVNDLIVAKELLNSNKYTVGIFNYYLDSIKLFQKEFKWKTSSLNRINCIRELSESSMQNYVEIMKRGFSGSFQNIFDSNSYDVSLYFDFLKKMKECLASNCLR